MTERHFIEPEPGAEIKVLGQGPVLPAHYQVKPGAPTAAFPPDWRLCPICRFQAKHRGLVIHTIRVLSANRNVLPAGSDDRKAWISELRINIRRLREMGPGPVTLPMTPDGTFGEPIEWWGPKPEDD